MSSKRFQSIEKYVVKPDARVDLIDYGGGNVASVQRCLERLDVPYRLIAKPSGDAPIILPGVGAFGAVVQSLKQLDLYDPLKAMLSWGTPYLGICVGMQILFEASEESPGVEGLGILPAMVKRFDPTNQIKIPQIGWNWLAAHKSNWPEGYAYFVNSYMTPLNTGVDCSEVMSPSEWLLYSADYGQRFAAAVQWKNITGFQFHAEKSDEFGHGLISRWYRDLTS